MRIGIYARYSTENQSETSIEDQVRRAQEWVARNHDGAEALVFSDYGISGTVENRPGYQALRQHIESGKLDLVVAESVDRLARNTRLAGAFKELVGYHGVTLVCLDGTRLSEDDSLGAPGKPG